MTKLLIPILSVLSLSIYGQKIHLDWKIGKNESLSYMTVMSDIDTSSIEMNFGGLFKALSDSSNKGLSEAQDFFKRLNKSLRNVDLISTLTNKRNGIIDIEVFVNKDKNQLLQTDSAKDKQKDFYKMIQAMTQGIMLRGSVYESGAIHSFWVKSNQKNLISLFFELPTKAVEIGDSWNLDINLIANDQNFKCDSSYKVNQVTLIDIKKVNGDDIAVLKYDIKEFVSGEFNMSAFTSKSEKSPSMMKFSHQAIAEFSIKNGRWVTYDGIMTLVATGVMTANKKTKFTLVKI